MANSASTSPSPSLTSFAGEDPSNLESSPKWHEASHDGTNIVINISSNDGSTGKGILIGMLSAFGSAAFVILVFAIFYFFRYTSRGRIFLDRIGRPGEYDDEQAFAREETEALEDMDDLQRAEYLRAKGEAPNFATKKLTANTALEAFVQANPPETIPTDISLSQFLAIQEKGVSAWEFEPEIEIANCFVEGRTEIEFFDSECSVQSNLPIPKQNEVYYWEAKMYDKPESSVVSVGVSTKPYPLFRLPGLHKNSIAYTSPGQRRYNQPFRSTNYGPEFVQGDVVGVGYRPRTGSLFFTRNGKKLDDVAHGLKTQNFFPTIGANGPCTVHVNFGQSGFVFIEANVKKWGLAPMTGSLAPPPPYGSEQGSILLEAGREGARHTPNPLSQTQGHARSRSGVIRITQPVSPGPERSPTEISLAQLAHIPSQEDVGEGTSRVYSPHDVGLSGIGISERYMSPDFSAPPPEYTSPEGSVMERRFRRDSDATTRADEEDTEHSENASLISSRRARNRDQMPIPSYDAAVRGHEGGGHDDSS